MKIKINQIKSQKTKELLIFKLLIQLGWIIPLTIYTIYFIKEETQKNPSILNADITVLSAAITLIWIISLIIYNNVKD